MVLFKFLTLLFSSIQFVHLSTSPIQHPPKDYIIGFELISNDDTTSKKLHAANNDFCREILELLYTYTHEPPPAVPCGYESPRHNLFSTNGRFFRRHFTIFSSLQCFEKTPTVFKVIRQEVAVRVISCTVVLNPQTPSYYNDLPAIPLLVRPPTLCEIFVRPEKNHISPSPFFFLPFCKIFLK